MDKTYILEEFEDIKEVIRIRISNSQKKEYKGTSNKATKHTYICILEYLIKLKTRNTIL